MNLAWRMRVYDEVSEALRRQPGESLRDAAQRAPHDPVAAAVLAIGDKRHGWAWLGLAKAAAIARGQQHA